MKLSNLKTITLALLAAAFLAAPSAHAVLTYNSDDIFMGFHQTGNTTKEYIINLGPASQFRDAAAPLALSISTTAFAADMVNAFGATWRTSGDILWGFAGTTQNTAVAPPDNIIRLLYVSEPVGTEPIASNGQSTAANRIIGFKNNWQSFGTERTVANSANGDPTVALNSWTSSMADAFGATGNIGPVEDLLANPLDFFRVPQLSTGQLMTNEGRFSINFSNDTITFFPTPEPSSIALLGAALTSLGFRRFRRAALSV